MKSGKFFYITIFFIVLLGVYAGLADFDFYWQSKLGEAELLRFDWYACTKQLWGTKGLGSYLDHEWLCNIIFYLFSLIPYRPLVWLKLAICIVSAVAIIKFFKLYRFGETGKAVNKLAAVGIIFIYAVIFLKIKAYSLSFVLLLAEIIVLEKIEGSLLTKDILKLSALALVWVNFHSGSLPIFFLNFVVYSACKRWKKAIPVAFLLLGVCLINPYDYELLVFNIRHATDSVMQSIILDWRALDAGSILGLLTLVVILHGIVSVPYNKSINTWTLLMGMGTCYMTLCSVRHCIYLIPFVLYFVIHAEFPTSLRVSWKCPAYFFAGCFTVLFIQALYISDYDNYSMSHADGIDVINEDGLFVEYGLLGTDNKAFFSGAYPACAERSRDAYLLTTSAGVDSIEKIIAYYDLKEFVFFKYNTNSPIAGIPCPLYDYLSESDDYEKKYDDGVLVHFVEVEHEKAIVVPVNYFVHGV